MEVVSDGEDSLAGRVGRHGHGLKALVVTERIGDPGKGSGVAADEAGKRAVRAVSCAGDVVDAAAAVDRGESQARCARRVGYNRAAGIMALILIEISYTTERLNRGKIPAIRPNTAPYSTALPRIVNTITIHSLET